MEQNNQHVDKPTSVTKWTEAYEHNGTAQQKQPAQVARDENTWTQHDEQDLRMFAKTHERYKQAIAKRFRLEGR